MNKRRVLSLAVTFILFMSTPCLFAKEEVFPNGVEPLSGTQTKKKNNISVNFGALINNMLAVEYETMLFSDNVSFVGQGLLNFTGGGIGAGLGAGARYHFAPTLDGLFVGGLLRFYFYSYKDDLAWIEYKYNYFTIQPYGEIGYRLGFWDKLSLQAAFQLGITFDWYKQEIESGTGGTEGNFNDQSLFFGFAFGVGYTF